MKLVIMQGLPGAGKGFVTKRDYKGSIVCSADDFFRLLNSDYDNGGVGFDARLLGEAHRHCLSVCLDALKRNSPIIVVDNTNLENEAIAPYVALGGLFGYEVEICRVECPADIAAGRNKHGVPPGAYSRMASMFDNWKMWPPWKFSGVNLRVVRNG